jgi:polyisoprenoid-binding protein YceI
VPADKASRLLRWLLILPVIALGVAVLGPYVFFHFVEGSAPGRFKLPPAQGVDSRSLAPGELSGTWNVSTGSEAGYRVDEILLGQKHTAVGRTPMVSASGKPKVTGGVIISGTTVVAADFTVNTASIKSDQPSRDAQWNGFIMETYKYPNAKFHLTQPIAFGSAPAPGKVVTEQATGQLTMRGVSRTITFPIQAEVVGGALDLNAEISITYSQWKIPNPSFALTHLGRTGIIEVLLDMTRAPAPST